MCEHVCIFLCLCQSHRRAQVSFLLINFSAFEILASSQFSLLMQPNGLVNMTYTHDKKKRKKKKHRPRNLGLYFCCRTIFLIILKPQCSENVPLDRKPICQNSQLIQKRMPIDRDYINISISVLFYCF